MATLIKKKSECSRRMLVGLLGTGIVAGYTGCANNVPPPGLRVASVNELAVGQTKFFEYPEGGNEAVLVRLPYEAEGGVGSLSDHVAFLVACPHMGCPITQIDTDKGQMGPCGCHRSLFDIVAAGRQIVGRACQRLVQVHLEIRGAEIYATGLSGLPYGQALEAV